MYLTHLTCSGCAQEHSSSVPQSLCLNCAKPLFAQYDLKTIAREMKRETLLKRPNSMWRYRELLPVKNDCDIVTLGEGMTPLLRVPNAAKRKGLGSLWVKNEAQNPTQSFKARGMSAAVSMAKQFGIGALTVPTAGNAGAALAAYAARAGIKAYIFMPRDSARANVIESEQLGACVTLVTGLITDCAAEIKRQRISNDWFDLSTLNEPYRIEGKKTMGFELAEQLNWILPSSIVYPTGGGSGLIGMWKAFRELQAIGLIGPKMPKMFSVQAEGCAPIVREFNVSVKSADSQAGYNNRASGLRVPVPLGSPIILDILKKSGGGAVAVTEEEILSAIAEFGAAEGIFLAPEGGAAYAALTSLLKAKAISTDESIVFFNTGAGIKYLEWFE